MRTPNNFCVKSGELKLAINYIHKSDENPDHPRSPADWRIQNTGPRLCPAQGATTLGASLRGHRNEEARPSCAWKDVCFL